jgi:hypothetical protein
MKSISRPAKATPEVEWLALPLPVRLPVCPQCGAVGKRPGGGSVTYACVGAPAEGTAHVRTRMVEITFHPDEEEIGT